MSALAIQAACNGDINACNSILRYVSQSTGAEDFVKMGGIQFVADALINQLQSIIRHELNQHLMLLIRILVNVGKINEFQDKVSDSGWMGCLIAIAMTDHNNEETLALSLEGINLSISSSEKISTQLMDQLVTIKAVERVLSIVKTYNKNGYLITESMKFLSRMSRNTNADKILVEMRFVDFLMQLHVSEDDEDNLDLNGQIVDTIQFIVNNGSGELTKKIVAVLPELFKLVKNTLSMRHQNGLYRAISELICTKFCFEIIPKKAFNLDENMVNYAQFKHNIVTADNSDKVLYLKALTQIMKEYPQIGVYLIKEHHARLWMQIFCSGVKHSHTSIVYAAKSILFCASKVIGRVGDRPDTMDDISICSIACKFALSQQQDTKREGIWLLQLLFESNKFHEEMALTKHLRGSLELGILQEDIQTQTLAKSLLDYYDNLIVQTEKRNGCSVIGLSELRLDGTEKETIDKSKKSKTLGNQYFQEGNYPASRLCYRHCVATLNALKYRLEHQFQKENIREHLTIGKSIMVLFNGKWKKCMISDMEDNSVDIILDEVDNGEDEEEGVPLSRIKLQYYGEYYEQWKKLQLDCLMNLSKSLRKMHLYEDCLEALSSVIEISKDRWEAFYLYGVVSMEVGILRDAKEYLLKANKLQPKNKGIQAAWKRLQVLYKRKKKADKRLIKNMMEHLSTIPGLNDIQ